MATALITTKDIVAQLKASLSITDASDVKELEAIVNDNGNFFRRAGRAGAAGDLYKSLVADTQALGAADAEAALKSLRAVARGGVVSHDIESLFKVTPTRDATATAAAKAEAGTALGNLRTALVQLIDEEDKNIGELATNKGRFEAKADVIAKFSKPVDNTVLGDHERALKSEFDAAKKAHGKRASGASALRMMAAEERYKEFKDVIRPALKANARNPEAWTDIVAGYADEVKYIRENHSETFGDIKGAIEDAVDHARDLRGELRDAHPELRGVIASESRVAETLGRVQSYGALKDPGAPVSHVDKVSGAAGKAETFFKDAEGNMKGGKVAMTVAGVALGAWLLSKMFEQKQPNYAQQYGGGQQRA